MDKLILSFYGLGIEVISSDSEVISDIKGDYSFFAAEKTKASVSIEVFSAVPDYSKLPPLLASIYTPRNICYTQDNFAYLDYYGKGLVIIDKNNQKYKVYSSEPHLRHEIVYLTIMSLAGEYLDSKGLHRVHGFAVDLEGKGVLTLLPRGGGKTTILLELIKADKVKLISEDSPLIDREGRLLPFPIRIGVSGKDNLPDVPQEYIHFLERIEFGPKYLIDIAAFRNKISKEPSSPQIILIGIRSLGSQSAIKPISKLKVFNEFIRNSVVGLGLYQGVEFILQRNIFELLAKFGVVFSRLRNAYKIIRRSRTYSFVVGSDRKNNLDTLLNFLENI